MKALPWTFQCWFLTKITALELYFSLQDLDVGAEDRVGQVQGAEFKK